MVKAVWNGQLLAQSDSTIVVEGNHYFPREALNPEFFKDSPHHTVCGWKGTASYYHVEVDGKINTNAAWYYPTISDAAKPIENYVAFWHGVQVEEA